MEINRGETRRRTHAESGPVNPTVQSQVSETDINAMSAKYLKSRMAGNPQGRKPMFIEVPSASFHEMMNKVARIRQDFERLSAKLRRRFMDDPGVMLAFVENPDNREECVKLGLIDDPELAYEIEARARAKSAKVEQQSLVPKADPEAQPSYKAPEGARTPSSS